MTYLRLAAAAVSAFAITAGAAMSQTTSLRIQTHFSPETLSGHIHTVLTDPQGATRMAEAALSVAVPDATDRLVALVTRLARGDGE